MNIHDIFPRLYYRYGAKRRIYEMNVGVSPFFENEQTAAAFEKIETALGLIGQYAPAKIETMRRDVNVILVGGILGSRGSYWPKIKMVELSQYFVFSPETSNEDIAGVLIHEAQHARLWRLGFNYDKKIRWRIERLCYRAQRNFAKLIPHGDGTLAHANYWLAADSEAKFRKSNRIYWAIEDMKRFRYPVPIIKFFEWLYRRLLAREEMQSSRK